MRMAPFVQESHLRVPWATSSTKVGFMCLFSPPILTSSLSIVKCREWMFAWNQQRHWDETRHFCKFCHVLWDFYKSLQTELAFCSLLQNRNMSVFSFRGKRSTVLPIIWLSATQLRPIKSHSRLSLATSEEWNRTLSSKYTALAAADFKSTAAQHGQHLRISTSCGVRISDTHKTTSVGKTRQVKYMEWCSSLS